MSTNRYRLVGGDDVPIGLFEQSLRTLIDEGIVLSLDSTEDEVESGTYFMTMRDRTSTAVVFDFTEFGEDGNQRVLCHWTRWDSDSTVTESGPADDGGGTWDEAAAWLRTCTQTERPT